MYEIIQKMNGKGKKITKTKVKVNTKRCKGNINGQLRDGRRHIGDTTLGNNN